MPMLLATGIAATAAATSGGLSTVSTITLSVLGGTFGLSALDRTFGIGVVGEIIKAFSPDESNTKKIDTQKEMDARAESLQQQVKNFETKHVSQLKSSNADFDEAVAILKKDSARFKDFIESHQSTALMMSKLTKTCDETQQMVSKIFQNRADELTLENERLKESSEQLHSKTQSLEASLQETTNTLDDLRRVTDDERTSYEQMRQDLHQAQSDIERLNETISEKNRQIQILNQECLKYQGFFSQLTAANQSQLSNTSHQNLPDNRHNSPS